VMGCINVAI